MSDRRLERENCTQCGTSLSHSPSQPASAHSFCSPGCRDVYAVFGASEIDTNTGVEHPSRAEGAAENEGTERTFFRVDGMYSPLCESFLESKAGSHVGVSRVEASYVTETVRVDHDPDAVSKDDLVVALSGVGYTAYLRDGATGGNATSSTTGVSSGDDTSNKTGASGGDGASGEGGYLADPGGTQRSREMSGFRKRQTDEMLEVRYIVGIVFGSFLLVPYVAILYPVYLSSFSDWGMLGLYEDAFASFDGPLFLSVFFVLTGVVLYLTGMPLLRGAYVSLKLRRVNSQLLATLTVVSAFGYSTLAVVLGRNDVYYDLTILVATIVMAATFYDAKVKRRAAGLLTDLTVSQVDQARRFEPDGTTRTIPIEELESDDRVLVRRGERIPVDGVLAEGTCTVDEAVVTGESLPLSKRPGDDIVGGSVVTTDAAVVDVDDEPTSSIDRLTRVVWNRQSATHGVARRADVLASRVLPLVLSATLVVGGVSLVRGESVPAASMALLLTVFVSSPWALGLATPLTIASSIREGLEHGIVVFDETVLERLRDVDTIVFDKTGTLTTGKMAVLEADAPADLLRAAAAVERRASHPAGEAITAAFTGEESEGDGPRSGGGSSTCSSEREPRVEEFHGHATGVEGVVDGRTVLVGHPTLFTGRGWALDDDLERRVDAATDAGHLPVVVGRDGAADGLVVVGDDPKDGWAETVAGIGERGLEVVVLTGDDEAATEAFRRHPHVDHVFAGVPPAGKTAALRRLKATACVAMVGDGTNDAPALAEADLGISLGSGTALASDAADLAIVDDDLSGVERAIVLSNAANRRFTQNLGLALGYNALVIPIALAGLLNPLFTTLALLASTALVAANSSRALLP